MKKEFFNVAILAFLFIMIVAAQIIFSGRDNKTDDIVVVNTDCRLDLKDCVIPLAETTIRISADKNIKPLEAFSIELTEHSSVIQSVFLDLSMLEMDMGKNQFVFSKTSQKQWKSTVVIPVCTTGRRDWMVELYIKLEKKQYSVNLWLQI